MNSKTNNNYNYNQDDIQFHNYKTKNLKFQNLVHQHNIKVKMEKYKKNYNFFLL